MPRSASSVRFVIASSRVGPHIGLVPARGFGSWPSAFGWSSSAAKQALPEKSGGAFRNSKPRADRGGRADHRSGSRTRAPAAAFAPFARGRRILNRPYPPICPRLMPKPGTVQAQGALNGAGYSLMHDPRPVTQMRPTPR